MPLTIVTDLKGLHPMRSWFALLLIVCMSLLTVSQVTAQDEVFISLNAATADLQTGQEYEIQIQVENVVDLWRVTSAIQYDPALVYVTGTVSGSPVTVGDFMSSAPTLTARNQVNDEMLQYTVSRLGSTVDPVSGTGIVGTFRIYPIAPGTTQLLFSDASLGQLVTADDGTRSTIDLPVTPILLDLTITGDPVPIPDEATPTPAPTTTPILAQPDTTVDPNPPTEEPLVNVTRAPEAPTDEIPPAESNNSLILIAVLLVVVALVGLVALFFVYRRSQK